MASLKTEQVFSKDTKVTLPGKTHSVEVPPIATGTWSWGDTGTWKYEEKRDFPGIQEVWNKLTTSNLGFFDGAEVYGMGENERILGKLLKSTPAEDRTGVVIATKWLPVPFLPHRLFPKGVVGCLKDSLQRLGVDSVDLYKVHAGWTYFFSIDSVAKGLAECVNLGLAKTVGVSNYSTENMIKIYDAMKKLGVPLASNQIEFSLLRTLPNDNGLLAACHERGIVPLAYSPLAQGRLTGKYSAANPPDKSRYFSRYPMEKIDPLVDVMRKVAEKHNVPISAVALNYVMCKGAIPLGGARNAKQAEQNMQAIGWRLSDEEVKELETLSMKGTTSTWQRG